jgi:hypothetical protein
VRGVRPAMPPSPDPAVYVVAAHSSQRIMVAALRTAASLSAVGWHVGILSTYLTSMKPVQVMIDDELLTALDATDEVRAEGRSAVLRRAAAEYLARRRRREIREQYVRAYGESGGLGDEFSGWEEQGTWPED